MSFNEEAINTIARYCRVYNLIFRKTDAGILVDNGHEFFVIKLKQQKVRKLFHQNYNKGQGKKLPVDPADLTNEVMRALFHDQKWIQTDIQQTLLYIQKHGTKRHELYMRRQAILAQFA